MQRILSSIALALPLLGAGIASAHHSFGMFDRTHTVTVQATIYKFEFKNPHAWLWIYVPSATGGQEIWGLETGGPSLLNRLGVGRHTFNTGDKVTIGYHPLRDGEHGGELASAVLANGESIDMMARLRNFSAGQ